MRRKVTLKVFTPLLHQVESQLEALHMKRDSFLDHLIDRELPHLESDLNGKRLSVSARRFIARSLKRLGTSQINVQLDSGTAERLDELANNANLVRDSFINRLLYLCFGSEALLKYFEVTLNDLDKSSIRRSTGYFQALHEVQIDPLGGLRRLVKVKHGLGLYVAPLPLELAAFECYLDDDTFWDKYGTLGNGPASTSDLLQSFESRIYQVQLSPAQGSI